jgi:hypothetical protein
MCASVMPGTSLSGAAAPSDNDACRESAGGRRSSVHGYVLNADKLTRRMIVPARRYFREARLRVMVR